MSRARRSALLVILLVLGVAGSVGHARRAAPRGYPIAAVPFSKVRLTDEFWTSRVETNRTVTIPFGFKKSEEEGRVRNFEHAARHDGVYEGKMPFDLMKTFAPIGMIGEQPIAVAVNKDVAAKSVAELIALANKTQGGMLFAATNRGGQAHLTGELFRAKSKANISFVHAAGAAVSIRGIDRKSPWV